MVGGGQVESPHPAFDAAKATVAAKTPRLRQGLDQGALQKVKNQELAENPIHNLTARYFDASNSYLNATDKRIAELEAQFDNLGVGTKAYINGLDHLRHLSPKDLDRLDGRVMAKLMLEAASAQIEQGTTAIPDATLEAKIAEAQSVWSNLTPRARAQVQRGLRDLATDSDIWAQTEVKIGDWTLHQTLERGEKNKFKEVLDDTVNKMREVSKGFGAENYKKGVDAVIRGLGTQIQTDTANIRTHLEEGIKNLQDGIGVFSTQPDTQKKVSEHLAVLTSARDAFLEKTQSATDAQWNDEYLENVREAVTAADTICKQTDSIVAKAGLKGKVAGIAPEVAETKHVGKATIIGESAIGLKTGVDIMNELGLLEHDLRARVGKYIDIDINPLVQKVPFFVGLRQAREVFQRRTNEQLKAVSALLSGEISDKVNANLAVFKDEQRSVEDRLTALRALKTKGTGADLGILNDFRNDVAAFAAAHEPKSGLTDEMREAWKELHQTAQSIEQSLVQTTAQKIDVNESITEGIGTFAVESLKEHLKEAGLPSDDAKELFSGKGWREYVTKDQGRFAGFLRSTLLSPFYLNRSPHRLTGVNKTDDGFRLGGCAKQMGKGLSVLESVAGNPGDALTVVLQNSKSVGELDPQIAYFLVRAGWGEAGERIRSLWHLAPEMKGMGGEVSALKFLNTVKPESRAGWYAVGAASVVAGVEAFNAIAPAVQQAVGQAGIHMDQSNLDNLQKLQPEIQRRLVESQQAVENFKGTHIEQLQVGGPQPPFNKTVEDTGRDVMQKLIDAKLAAAQSGLTDATSQLTQNTDNIQRTAQHMQDLKNALEMGKLGIQMTWEQFLVSSGIAAAGEWVVKDKILPRLSRVRRKAKTTA